MVAEHKEWHLFKFFRAELIFIPRERVIIRLRPHPLDLMFRIIGYVRHIMG